MNEFDAWLVDLDGTLYRPLLVKAAMALELGLGGWPVMGVLRQFRKEHEHLRTLPPPGGDPFRAQVLRTAEATGVPEEQVEIIVREWMVERPGKYLRLYARGALVREIRDFRQQGGRTAIVSDYPARPKLAAMGLADLFDAVVASGEAGGPPRLKPHPAGYLLAADRLGVSPARCLVIGDRPDADGEAATEAGMAFRRVG
jgi:HAD superfamily hydrolase (TIGR01549 family)